MQRPESIKPSHSSKLLKEGDEIKPTVVEKKTADQQTGASEQNKKPSEEKLIFTVQSIEEMRKEPFYFCIQMKCSPSQSTDEINRALQDRGVQTIWRNASCTEAIFLNLKTFFYLYKSFCFNNN